MGCVGGEEVEFAYGKLVRVRNSFGQWWDVVDDWPANRQPYTVEWELSPEGRELLFGPLEKAEQAYMRRPGRRPRRRSGAAANGAGGRNLEHMLTQQRSVLNDAHRKIHAVTKGLEKPLR